jgi:hypothetical protein
MFHPVLLKHKSPIYHRVLWQYFFQFRHVEVVLIKDDVSLKMTIEARI